MTTRPDRLAGLGVWLAGLAGARLAVVGVGEPALATLAAMGVDTVLEGGAADAGLLVLGRPGDLDAVLSHGVSIDGPVLALWPTGPTSLESRRTPAGWTVVARYAVTPAVGMPTHLVRLDQPEGRRWFAADVRPAWGAAGRAARRIGGWPLLGRLGFQGEGVLLVPAAGPTSYPAGQPETAALAGWRDTAPVVLSLGGGSTGGRVVLSYGDVEGRVRRHVKVDPLVRSAGSRAEWEALGRLADPDPAPGVPVQLASATTTTWYAAAQGHLPGPSLERHWSGRGAADRDADIDAVLAWMAAVTAPRGLVHGDLWPANVVRGPGGIGVFDWEGAGVGGPLADAVQFLITATRGAEVDLPAAAVTALTDPRLERRLGGVLASAGLPVPDSAGLRLAVLEALIEIAERPAPGGIPDPARRAAWLACRDRLAH